MSDVPIKVNDLAIIISDMKSLHTITARKWMNVKDVDGFGTNSCEGDINAEFMIHPNKLYKISFIGEPYQFYENSELRVSGHN